MLRHCSTATVRIPARPLALFTADLGRSHSICDSFGSPKLGILGVIAQTSNHEVVTSRTFFCSFGMSRALYSTLFEPKLLLLENTETDCVLDCIFIKIL